MRFVANEGDDHAVEVKEEHQQVETKLDERFLCSVSELLDYACAHCSLRIATY